MAVRSSLQGGHAIRYYPSHLEFPVVVSEVSQRSGLVCKGGACLHTRTAIFQQVLGFAESSSCRQNYDLRLHIAASLINELVESS